MDIGSFPAAERVVEQMSKKEELLARRDQPKPNWTLDIVKNEEYGQNEIVFLSVGQGVSNLTRKEMYPLVNITERFLLYLWLDNEKSLILNQFYNISYLRGQIKGIERCQSWRVSPMLACLFLFLSAVWLYFCRLFVCISVDCLFVFLSTVCLYFYRLFV